MAMCPECMGDGIIITCCDDMCNGIGHCIHGDGEEVCPECDGSGEVDDWEDADDGIADGYGDDHEYVGYGASLNYDIALVQCRAV